MRLALGVALVIALLVAWRLMGPEYLVDDAWISFRVARNWLETGALTYDVARPPLEGMTNLLWTLLSTVWVALLPGRDPASVGRLVGLACHLGTVMLIARLAARESARAGGNAALAAAVAGALVATCTSLAYNAMSGLETGLWGLLFAVALDRTGLALSGDRRAAVASGVALGLLAWTRPEGILAGGVLTATVGLSREQRGTALRIALPFGAFVVALCAFRLATYGALVPNTFHAKPPSPASGLHYFASFALYGLGIVGPIAAFPALRRSRTARLAGVVAVAMVLGTIWSGGDWMPGFRRLTLPVLVLFALAGIGCGLARGGWRPACAIAIAGVFAAHAYTAVMLPQRTFDYSVREQLARAAEATPGVKAVALADIGVFGWHFRGSVFDLAGLTDAHIAALPGEHGHKEWDEAYFRERSPELVLVLGNGDWAPPLDEDFRVREFELGVLRSVVTNGGYRYHTAVPVSGTRKMLVLAREDAALDPRLWGPPDERDLVAELRAFRARKLAAVDGARTAHTR